MSWHYQRGFHLIGMFKNIIIMVSCHKLRVQRILEYWLFQKHTLSRIEECEWTWHLWTPFSSLTLRKDVMLYIIILCADKVGLCWLLHCLYCRWARLGIVPMLYLLHFAQCEKVSLTIRLGCILTPGVPHIRGKHGHKVVRRAIQ